MTSDAIAKAILTDNKCIICKHRNYEIEYKGMTVKKNCGSWMMNNGENCDRWELDEQA